MVLTPTAERLRELFHYNKETGLFTRLPIKRDASGAARVAGSMHARSGYIELGVDGHSYLAHRLAWIYVTGQCPTGDIDHRNGMRSDNRFANLRDATRAENAQNRQLTSTSAKTGLLGTCKSGSGFKATIRVGGRSFYLGTYATPEEAHEVYLAEKRKRHPGCTI